jgi:hypothetical protein
MIFDLVGMSFKNGMLSNDNTRDNNDVHSMWKAIYICFVGIFHCHYLTPKV